MKSVIVSKVCEALSNGHTEAAKEFANNYPFKPATYAKRAYSEFQSTQIFIRDGFIDRYSGQRLIFPGAIRLLSILLPDQFPFHPNWKMSECHLIYWELFPTIDHILPIARGGLDQESNWVCTSMLRNSAKSNWTLEDLGWQIYSGGKIQEWDGLTKWFLDYIHNHQDLIAIAYIAKWYKAANLCIDSLN